MPRGDPEVIALGEALVEIMRTTADQPFHLPGPFDGPFPSRALAVFEQMVAKHGAAGCVVHMAGWQHSLSGGRRREGCFG
jgi:hypothetical protein